MHSPMLLDLAVEGGETPRHCHAEGQVFVIRDGIMAVTTETGRWLMPRGRMGWIPPFSHHAAHSQGRVRGAALYVPAARVTGLPDMPCVFAVSPLAEAVLERMAGIDDDDRRDHLLAVLLDELKLAPAEPLHIPMPEDPRLLNLVQGLLAAPGDRRSLDQWACRIGMSRRTLMRRMLSQTGLSFGAWRQRMRLFAALPLLADGLSVTNVALDLGFDSVSAFIACFRQHFGITPARYFRNQPR